MYASGGGATALYTVPFRSRNVGFSYLAYWSRTPAGYAISGSSAGGVPASPVYRQRVSGLARLTLTVRSGAAPAQYPCTRVRVLASVNGGASWQQVTVSRHGSNWLAVVHDPASGYVALRSS